MADGTTKPIELIDSGITSIDFAVDLSAPVSVVERRGGNTVCGCTDVEHADGSRSFAGDVAFGHANQVNQTAVQMDDDGVAASLDRMRRHHPTQTALVH